MVYFIVITSCRIYICNCFEGHRVIGVLGLLLSVLPSLNKAYYCYYYYYSHYIKLIKYAISINLTVEGGTYDGARLL